MVTKFVINVVIVKSRHNIKTYVNDSHWALFSSMFHQDNRVKRSSGSDLCTSQAVCPCMHKYIQAVFFSNTSITVN